jgi:adenylate cyclase
MGEPAPLEPSAQSEAPFRVLVVDDDPDMTAFLAHLLRKQGIDVETAGDGEAALAQVAKAKPDLMLLDVMMPGPSGFDVCRKLKSDHGTALMPVVLVTALGDKESRVKGIEAGADDFLAKPVDPLELMARVNTLRRLHDTRRELESRRLAADVQRKEAIRKAFSRYISPRLADRIIQDIGIEGGPFKGSGQRINMVAAFAELRGIPGLVEGTEASEVVEMLNQYFTILTDAAYQHDGTIFSMSGDSLLVGFNVPFLQSDAATRALRAAQDMVRHFGPAAVQWERRYGVRTGVSVGICMGEAIIGNVGSTHYMNYTVIGDPINTAARLMQAAGINEILICGRVYEAVRDLLPAGTISPHGDIALRGRSEPAPVFSVRT